MSEHPTLTAVLILGSLLASVILVRRGLRRCRRRTGHDLPVTEIAGVHLINVHDESRCAGKPCVIHNPSTHHMRHLPLRWRQDRGMFERICEHGCGHPDPDQVAYWREAAKSWRPPINADVIDDPFPPSNPFDGLGVHGCCPERCCQAAAR